MVDIDPILQVLADARRTLRLSQVQMGRLAGTTQSAISDMEGPAGNPTLKTLRRLLDLLGLELTVVRRPLSWEQLEAIEAATQPESAASPLPLSPSGLVEGGQAASGSAPS